MSTTNDRLSTQPRPIVNHLSPDGFPWAADPSDFHVDRETRKCTNFVAPSSPSSPPGIIPPWPVLEVIPGQRNSYRSSYYYSDGSDSESPSSDGSWDFVDVESVSTAPSTKDSQVRVVCPQKTNSDEADHAALGGKPSDATRDCQT